MSGVHVLIVGNSDVTRVVMAKIMERSGFRTLCVRPEGAAEALRNARPSAIVLDGGADNRECDGLVTDIAALRETGGGELPAVVLLSNRQTAAHGLPDGMVDAVIAKPITPERVQPVMARLLAGV